MAELTFSQSEHRSYLVPGLIVLVIVAVAAGLIYKFTPHRIADLAVTHTVVVPIHTGFSSGSQLVGAQATSQDDLYVFTTVRIDDKLKLPPVSYTHLDVYKRQPPPSSSTHPSPPSSTAA